jgi:hypothetical protein
MSTNSDDDGQHEEDSNTVAHLDDQVEKVVVIDGKEVKVKVSDTHSQARRGPKVTFRIQEKRGAVHYAKIYLPKTHEVHYNASFGRRNSSPLPYRKPGWLLLVVLGCS